MRRSMRVALAAMAATVAAVGVPINGVAGAEVADSPAGIVTGAFTVQGSVNQVAVTDLTEGDGVELVAPGGSTVDSGVADSAGTHLFREVPAADGYTVRRGDTVVGPVEVTDPTDHPDDSFYADLAATEPLSEGFGYLTTRDGTKLSVNVTFPLLAEPGPWPVVVNYSGYDPSQPGLPPREALAYAVQGYVVVGVNMRGTGCSGGAFEFFEDLQSTDGYDVIETIAHQPWSNGDVGMVGISYSGYSQLYVAATQPPHLRAITPLSPYSDTYSAILYPGGILNDGFAYEWAEDRQNGARPRARGWVRDQIGAGDSVCDENQALRLQSKPLLDRILSTPFADHEYDYLNTETFVDQIEVPTYLASQWQDEQTGGSAANLIPLFDPDTLVFANFTNGSHVEPMVPSEMTEVMAFVDLYVGRRVPAVNPLLRSVAPDLISDLFRSDDDDVFAFPADQWAHYPDLASARAAFESRPRVKLRWENGGVPGHEGQPAAVTETFHSNWPLDGLVEESLFLHADGELQSRPTGLRNDSARSVSSYQYDPTSKRRKTYDGGTEDMWAPHPDVHWDTLDEDDSLSFVTDPYSDDVAYAGQGSVDLWLRSSESDTDLEVTLTEVRPDGHEVFIQSGWLRASHRALDPAVSTSLVPFHTHQPEDYELLPPGEFTPVRIEMFPFAHVIRAGSQLRLNIEAPGGNQPFWAFRSLDGTAINEIAHSSGRPSKIVLPRVPAGQAPAMPAALPACELAGVSVQSVSLRNQPCRPYEPARTATDVVLSTPRPDLLRVDWEPPVGATPDSYRVEFNLAANARGPYQPPRPVVVPGDTTFVEVRYGFRAVPLEVTVTPVYGGDDGRTSSASIRALSGGGRRGSGWNESD